MKNKTFFHSVKCATKGLLTAIKEEKNYWIYFLHVAITLPVNILLNFTMTEFLIYGITIACVFGAECFNTAIERICNFLTEEYNEKIGVIKDLGSAGVLCCGLAFYITEIVLIGMRIF